MAYATNTTTGSGVFCVLSGVFVSLRAMRLGALLGATGISRDTSLAVFLVGNGLKMLRPDAISMRTTTRLDVIPFEALWWFAD